MSHDICELWRMRIHKDTFSIEKEEFEYRQADQQARHLVDETWWNVACVVTKEDNGQLSPRRIYVYATLAGEEQVDILPNHYDSIDDLNLCLFMLARLMPSSSTLIML